MFHLGKIKSPTITAIATLTAISCGGLGGDMKKYHKDVPSANSTKSDGSVAADTTNTKVVAPDTADIIVPYKCDRSKSALNRASGAMQLAWGRVPTEVEKTQIAGKEFNYETLVDKLLADQAVSYAIGHFITNALGLNNINPDPTIDEDDDVKRVKDAMQVADLRKEPIKLVESIYFNDEPWSKVFSADYTFCTKNTAELYNAKISDADAFVPCELPADRKAGLLGLVSTMRANPSSILRTNNNYHRVALVVYLTLGFKLLAATNAPPADAGKGRTLDACVPTVDNRVSSAGLVYGTVAIPAVDTLCADCHNRYHVGIKQAFTRIGDDGRSLTFEDVDKVSNQVITDLGTTRDFIKRLLNEETDSCWNPKEGPYLKYSGLPGLAKIIVDSGTLGTALGNIIPIEWANEPANANSSSTIINYYNKNKGTLKSAFKGFLMSESFACEAGSDANNKK